MLNPRLYDQLKKRFGREPRVTNEGVQNVVHHETQMSRHGPRRFPKIDSFGEAYYIDCPRCNDSRRRLVVNHAFGDRDPQTGTTMLFGVRCFNEDCFKGREAKRDFYNLVWNGVGPISSMHRPEHGVRAAPPEQRPAPAAMPACEPVANLAAGHPAVEFLRARGHAPYELARVYGLGYCALDLAASPPIREPHLVVPMRRVGLARVRGAYPVELAGWQARVLREGASPKYLSARGMQTARLAYGLAEVRDNTGWVAIVEGVRDVWRVGSAIGLLGKTVSGPQQRLIATHLAGRPLVVLLDRDATAEARAIRDRIRRERRDLGDPAPTVVGSLPEGRGDPAECTPEEIERAVAAALG